MTLSPLGYCTADSLLAFAAQLSLQLLFRANRLQPVCSAQLPETFHAETEKGRQTDGRAKSEGPGGGDRGHEERKSDTTETRRGTPAQASASMQYALVKIGWNGGQ